MRHWRRLGFRRSSPPPPVPPIEQTFSTHLYIKAFEGAFIAVFVFNARAHTGCCNCARALARLWFSTCELWNSGNVYIGLWGFSGACQILYLLDVEAPFAKLWGLYRLWPQGQVHLASLATFEFQTSIPKTGQANVVSQEVLYKYYILELHLDAVKYYA